MANGPRDEALRNALRTAGIGTFSFSPKEGLVLDETYAALLGYSAAELPSDLMAWFPAQVHPEDLRAVAADQQLIIQGEADTSQRAFRIRNASGEYLWVQGTASRTEDGVVGTIQDISKHVRNKEDAETFASIAAHDLKAPMRTIGMMIEFLQENLQGRLDGDEPKKMSFVVSAAQKMMNLIDDLLAYARAGVDKVDFETIELGKVVEATKKALAADIEQSEAIIQTGELPAVWGNGTQLGQLVQNLVANAIKHHPAQPTIRIEAEAHADRVVLSVHDNGAGIAADNLDKVMLPFQRLNSAAPGSGIGLAIVQRIAHLHGGAVTIQSEVGRGTSFSVSLPAVQQGGGVP